MLVGGYKYVACMGSSWSDLCTLLGLIYLSGRPILRLCIYFYRCLTGAPTWPLSNFYPSFRVISDPFFQCRCAVIRLSIVCMRLENVIRGNSQSKYNNVFYYFTESNNLEKFLT